MEFFLVDVRAMAREHINLKFSAKNSSILYSTLCLLCHAIYFSSTPYRFMVCITQTIQYSIRVQVSSSEHQTSVEHRTTTLFSCSCSLTQKGMVGPFNGAHDLLHPIQELVHTLMLVELGRAYFGAKIIEFRLPKTHSAV